MSAADDKMEIDDSLYRLVSMAVLTFLNIFLVVYVMIKSRVYIVAQPSFRIAILYDIYLPGGGSQALWTGGWAD